MNEGEESRASSESDPGPLFRVADDGTVKLKKAYGKILGDLQVTSFEEIAGQLCSLDQLTMLFTTGHCLRNLCTLRVHGARAGRGLSYLVVSPDPAETDFKFYVRGRVSHC